MCPLMWGWMNLGVGCPLAGQIESTVINDLRREGSARCQGALRRAQPRAAAAAGGTIRTSKPPSLLRRYRGFHPPLGQINTAESESGGQRWGGDSVWRSGAEYRRPSPPFTHCLHICRPLRSPMRSCSERADSQGSTRAQQTPH